MKRVKLLFLMLFILPTLMVDAQTLSNRERRHINSKILSIIDEYEHYATVYDYNAEYAFKNLFVQESVPVVCDLIGFPSYLSQIPLSDYVKYVSEVSSTISMEIKDVKKGEMHYSGGRWRIPVSFKKSVSYIDSNGYAFSINDFYSRELDMSMMISYDPDNDICLIESISGNIDSGKEFPKGRFFIVNKSIENDIPVRYHRYLSELKISGAKLNYNEFEQAIIPQGVPTVDDIDVLVSLDTLSSGFNYDVVGFKFDRRKGRMKIRYGMAPFGAYNVTTSPQITAKSNAMEVGVDFGITWSVGRSGKMGFYGGIGLSLSKIALSLGTPIEYSYTYSVFDDNSQLFKDLTADFNIASASEALKFLDILVPAYFEIEHRLGDHMLLSWNLGIKAYYNFRTKYVPYNVSGKLSISDEIDGGFDYNFNQSFTKFILPSSYKRSPLDISAMANLGLDVNLSKKKFYLMVKCGYEYGLTKSYTATGEKYCDSFNRVYPLIYAPDSDYFYGGYGYAGENITAMHSLIGNTSYHRQAIWLEIGLKLKM